MIPWTPTPTPQPKNEAEITVGPCHLSVCEHDGTAGKRWQYLSLSLGEFSDTPMDECLGTWPKRAVQLARQAITELDRKLQAMDE